ncbi:TetR/AcrR family transcriptional regulator [Amycolatopsis sp. NPDC051102]|uniref:TetR/AcrR family transcriptional regulator n=1 Tax=Amycolatopsis sp. NPDC051102 TaxID=3155163 RepID=UPI00342672EE
METDWTTEAPAKDRRVRRSRAALMRAAVELVSERDSTAVTVSEIAEAADVSRQVLYQQFGDRDALLLEAALDLVRRELLAELDGLGHPGGEHAALLALGRHFARYRRFYRALLTGASAFALNRALTGLFLPVNRQHLGRALGGHLDAESVEDLATFLTGGAGAVVNAWVVDGPDPLDPEEFAGRLLRMHSVVTTMITKEAGR